MGRLLCGDKDLCFVHNIAKELVDLVGTTATFYMIDQSATTSDPLYNEPIDVQYVIADCPVMFQSPSRTPEDGAEGFRMTKTSLLYVSSKDLEDNGLHRPSVGDVIVVWGQGYDVHDSSIGEGHWGPGGDTPVMYKVDVTRRTKALPKRVWLNQ